MVTVLLLRPLYTYQEGIEVLSEMASSPFVNLLVWVACVGCVLLRKLYAQPFDQNYAILWGGNHVSAVDQGREVHISLDQSSGASFGSKMTYNSGFFHMKIKLSNKDTAGVVTSFYLTSRTNHHDELDFEFLGNLRGKDITLQTNIFTNDHGNREQKIHLWFDPTADFHDYTILWNTFQVVFFVDSLPVRVFKNLRRIGVEYPSQPMQILASVWNGEDWATNGGKEKINWTEAPFTAQYQGFNIDGCSSSSSDPMYCSSPKLWWNAGRYRELTHAEKLAYEHVKQRYMTYDYCADKKRFAVPPPECGH